MKKTLVLLMLLMALACAPALADGYSIDGYEMTVRVRSDGSADVTEVLDYHFDDDYNGILSSFDVGDVTGLDQLALYVDGDTPLRLVDRMDKEPFTYTAERSGRMLNVQAYAPGRRGDRRFRYEYRLTGLCQRYLDTARLNYKLIGVNNQVPLRNASIIIELPGDVSDAWAHGAMSDSDIRKEGATLVYGPKTVQPGQFAEADVLFDEASLGEAPVIAQDMVDHVRTQEAEIANRMQMQLAARARWRDVLSAAAVIPAACFAALWVWLRRTVGFRSRPEPSGDLSALHGVRAAVAQWVHAGKVDTDGLTGTLLELVACGAVRLIRPEKEGEVPTFTLNKQGEADHLTAHQQCALSWLFQGGRSLRPDSLDAEGSESRAKSIMRQFDQYKNLVSAEAKEQGYVSVRNRNLWMPILLCVVCVALACGLFALGSHLVGCVTLVLVIAIIAMCCSLRRLSDEGEKVESALCALMERGRQGGAPWTDLVDYLPIIAALGGLDPFFAQLHTADWQQTGAFPYWMYMGCHHDIRVMRCGFKDTFAHNQQILSNSSSNGGGSSGGGGGGGGHGAW